MQHEIYADHAATAPLRAAALAAMQPYFGADYGNPSSLHAAGARAAEAVRQARGTMAALLGCGAREVYFTSGGTEADNQALLSGAEWGAAHGRRHFVAAAFEHPAVLRTLNWLETKGFSVTRLPIPQSGILVPEAVAAALRPDTAMVSVMAVNNEIGTVQPTAEIGALCRARGVWFHTDAVQAAGQLPIDLQAWQADYLALSAHKFGGPKGVGALLARREAPLSPLLRGGSQQRGMRAGTENVPGIVGMAAALQQARRDMPQDAAAVCALRAQLIEGLSAIPGARLTGDVRRRAPGIVHFCFAGVESEPLLVLLDAAGICASAGSACSAGALEPSAVLQSMGIPPAWAAGALRLSLGIDNDKEQIEYIVQNVKRIVTDLREKTA
ncbi:MAG: cysteine desulfurase [Faecalibacterium sp.]|jgi:cysteine desulfurase|nr:cysteine desulfurase [Faecalibacterium sp.]